MKFRTSQKRHFRLNFMQHTPIYLLGHFTGIYILVTAISKIWVNYLL
ncbi:uncharacterized protein METZ01_LOCUS209115, partial [marine metagenome]